MKTMDLFYIMDTLSEAQTRLVALGENNTVFISEAIELLTRLTTNTCHCLACDPAQGEIGLECSKT